MDHRQTKAWLMAATLAAVLLGTSGCDDKKSSRKNPTPKGGVPAAAAAQPAERGTLRAYYARKYSEQERQAVTSMADEVLTDYSPEEKAQAVAEILSYNHVVFHRTEWHNLDRNHATIRRHEEELRELCRIHSVPVGPILAITSWENSGDSTKVSWADAAGIGQMTWGAVEQAHEFAAEQARGLREKAQAAKRLAELTGDPEAMREAREMASLSERLDLAGRHSELARQAKVPDERLVAECNLEDAVVFFKFLLSMYGGRADHAIGAYHKGVANQDDIIYDYLKRKESGVAYPGRDRTAFIEAMERNHVTYLSLWNDSRSRQMLNGMRTVEGEITTPANANMALGDESDIYPWKVLGSLAAYRQGSEYVDKMIARYSGNRENAELDGMPLARDLAGFEKAIKTGSLVRLTCPIDDLGVAGRAEGRVRELSYYISPELDGYLWSLTTRWREACGDPTLRLPVRALSRAGALGRDQIGPDTATHLRGVAVSLMLNALPHDRERALDSILQADYLYDRVYRSSRKDGSEMVSLNPRFGLEFLAAYDKRGNGGQNSDVRVAADPRPAPSPAFEQESASGHSESEEQSPTSVPTGDSEL